MNILKTIDDQSSFGTVRIPQQIRAPRKITPAHQRVTKQQNVATKRSHDPDPDVG